MTQRGWPLARLLVLGGAVAGLVVAAPAVGNRADLEQVVSATPESALARALPDPADAPAERRWIERAVLACPGPDREALTEGPSGHVAVSAAPNEVLESSGETPDSPSADSGSDSGPVGLGVRATGGDPLLEALTRRPEDPLRAPLTAMTGVLVEATGAGAPGLAVAQIEADRARQGRGVSLTPCGPGASEQWLIAGDTGDGRAESIVLVNPGESPLTATVEVLGADGPVDTGSAGTVVVAPGEREIRVLDAVAPGVEAPVVRVVAEGGTVSAFLTDRWLDGARDHGQEVVAAGPAPATDLVIPGIPTTGEVALRVAVPGDRSAVVQVEALTAEGPRTLDTQALAAPDGRTTQVALTDLPAEALALRLHSDQPVVAAAQVTHTPDEVTDGTPGAAGELGWATASEALSGPAGIPLPDADLGVGASLVLTAPGTEGARAQVVRRTAEGEVSSEDVEVGAGSGLVLELGDAAEAWVVPQEGASGSLHGAIVVEAGGRSGPLLSIAALRTTALTHESDVVVPSGQ